MTSGCSGKENIVSVVDAKAKDRNFMIIIMIIIMRVYKNLLHLPVSVFKSTQTQ